MIISLRAQAGLEYLMTYGWALVLIVTVVAVLFFLFGSPKSSVIFSSSTPTKILLRTSDVSGTSAEVQLQNATGGKIQINTITPTNYSNCKINSSNLPISINGGSIMKLNCTAPLDNKGSIKIDYTDYAGMQRSVTINASGTGAGGGTSAVCGNSILEAGEECEPPTGFWPCDSCPFPLCEGYIYLSENNFIAVKKIASFSSKQDAMQQLSEKTIFFAMAGFDCSDSCTLINNGCGQCGNGTCNGSENAFTCPGDCPAVCGDGFCTHEENNFYSPEFCPADCS